MAGYAKLFARILDSTVWREDNETRILWIAMLAMADKNGNIFCTIPGLADRARISLKQCEMALHKFQQPDKYSWSREDEGRRIRVIDGGWFLINHAKYRAMLSKDEQRERTRVRVERYRARKIVTPVTSNAGNDIASTTTDTTTEVSKVKISVHFVHPTQEEAQSYFQKLGSNDFLHGGMDFFDFYESKGWKVGAASMKDWRAAARRWIRNNPSNGTMWRSPDGRIPSKHEARVAKNQSLLVNELGLGAVSRPGGEDLQDRASQRRTSDMGKVLRGRTSADG